MHALRRILDRTAVPALVAAIGALLLVAALQLAPSAGAQDPTERVLILGSSVVGGAQSLEAQDAVANGFGVDVVDDATWGAMTAQQFGSYRAIIIGDPQCGAVPEVAGATARTWGPQVDGNVVIIGSDPTYHAGQSAGARTTIRKGIDFAVNHAGRTGAYITLSCHYDHVVTPEAVAMLAGISGGGFLVRGSGCSDDAHIVAQHPALAGLTDEQVSNWGCSTHAGFTQWPADFLVLAIARGEAVGTDGLYTASDGTQGLPYILARGEALQTVRSITLAPGMSTGPVGSSHTVVATLEREGVRLAGQKVTFRVTDGPNAGRTGDATSNGDGVATFAYSSAAVGTDRMIAEFTDTHGRQTSNPVTRTWEAAAPPPGDAQTPAPNDSASKLAPPKAGESVNVSVLRGKIRVRFPGGSWFDFTGGGQMPVGTTVDARRGRVQIVAAADLSGATHTGEFYAGMFRIGQTRGSRPITTLKLRGRIPKTATDRGGGDRASAAAKRRKRKPRRLWGNATGRFRSKGRFSAATVRGTRWLVEDHCDYTLTRVRTGRVRVRDRVRRKTVTVSEGRRYKAWAPKAKRRRCAR